MQNVRVMCIESIFDATGDHYDFAVRILNQFTLVVSINSCFLLNFLIDLMVKSVLYSSMYLYMKYRASNDKQLESFSVFPKHSSCHGARCVFIMDRFLYDLNSVTAISRLSLKWL